MPEFELPTWIDILQKAPPGEYKNVAYALSTKDGAPALLQPSLRLYCENAECQGVRFFDDWLKHDTYSPSYAVRLPSSDYAIEKLFLTYRCRHCRSTTKTYALQIYVSESENAKENDDDKLINVTKYGEWPPLAPPTPNRLITLIGSDRELFLKGRRAEFQGLGMGAFAYYRRVVENQKGHLLEAAIKVAEKNNAPEEVIRLLNSAAQETQFSKAVDRAKEAFPDSLRINGHSPLTLLHAALSEGLHAESDADCLEIASSIRHILVELAERVDRVLKDKSELDSAVTRLIQRRQKSQGN